VESGEAAPALLGGGTGAGRAGSGAPLVPETERTKENAQQPSKWNEGPLIVRGPAASFTETLCCITAFAFAPCDCAKAQAVPGSRGSF